MMFGSKGWARFMGQDDHRKAVALAHVGWWGTALFAILRAFEVVPIQWGSFGLLTLGVGVAASLSLSRMRLSETIAQVFQVGLQSAITLSANVFTDTCIMSLSKDGIVESVDHADAIGWEPDELVGRKLRALLSPRSHGVRVLQPGTSMTSPMQNQKGDLFDARLSFAALHADGAAPPTMIVTISPVISIAGEGNYEIHDRDA